MVVPWIVLCFPMEPLDLHCVLGSRVRVMLGNLLATFLQELTFAGALGVASRVPSFFTKRR